MTDAPVDLDELERVADRSRCVDADQWAYRDLHNLLSPSVLEAIIAELRAARAPVAGVVTREHRALALQAVYPVTEHGKWPAEKHWVQTGESLSTASVQLLFLPRIAQAIADAEARGASRAAPPADEVAGLLDRDVPVVLSAIGDASMTWRDKSEALAALDRIAQHLKGKR